MSNPIIYRFALDMQKSTSNVFCFVQQGDTASRLEITLNENGEPMILTEGTTAILCALKSDGALLYNTATVDTTNNKIVYQFNAQTANVVGLVACQIKFTISGAVKSSPLFRLDVQNNAIDESSAVEESKDDINVLTGYIALIAAALENHSFDGAPGAKGDKGEKGDTGAAGAQGPAGADGYSPKIQKQSTADGTDLYIHWQKEDGSKTVTVVNILNGKDGAQGSKGEKGDTGAAGAKGDKGDTGATGPQGPAGPAGPQGPAGADGFSPTATVTKSGDTATITITDKNGITTTTIKDGSGVRVITPEESQGWDDEIPLTFAGDLYDIAGWNDKLWALVTIATRPGYATNYIWEPIATAQDLDDALSAKENTANKTSAITAENKTSSTLFPTVGATIQFIENNYYNKTSVDNKLIKVTYNQNGEGPSTSNTHFKRGDIWLDEAGDIWMVSWVSSNIISWKKVTRKVTGGMSDPPTTYFITAGTYPPYEQGDLYFKYGSSQNEVDAVFVLLNYSTSGTICYLKWIDLKSLVDLKNYYTKTEIDAKIAAITSLSFEVVQTKPTQNIKTNVIYLIPNGQSGTDNIYDEWIYVNNKWELIGSTAIDLSQYAKKSELPTKTSDLTNDSGFLTQHQDISGKENIANKVTSIDTSADDTHYPSALAVKNYVDTVIGGIENGSY